MIMHFCTIVLGKFCNCSVYRSDARNEVSVDKYYKEPKLNAVKVEYIQKDNELYGRYQAKKALSGQGMIR